ncbi:MAG: AMP-binding protein [Clostridia bacterium]|nr:AMP-binding protein [Clostridia bacterium]
MSDSILISGGTGFLGTALSAELLKMCDAAIYVLVRASSDAEASHRLREAWQHDGALYATIGGRVRPVVGDFTKPGLGLDAETADRLIQRVKYVFHVGAEVGFQKGEAELMAVNREGTRNMLAFAATLEGLRRFTHVSTAYVAGQRSGVIREDDPVGAAFSSLYEKSKAEAEALVRASGLPFAFCRPGMIVGDSCTGRAKSFNTVYYIMKRMLLGRLRVLPVKRGQRLNVVPVDYVAHAVAKIGLTDAAEGRTFHLTCPTAMQPRVDELTEYVRAWAEKNLDVRLPHPAFLPLNLVKRMGLAHNGKPEEKRRTPLNNLLTLAPYFFSGQDFDRSNTDALCGPYTLNWRDSIDALLEFACRANFMRQTGQTVFEQAMVRRASARYPIHFYDVRSDGLRCVSGREVNERVTAIADALRSWGVHKGDRVALTGINSVDYLALEQAVGLIGAISVPIYYTTPIPEAEFLLTKSGAKWFFVGDKRIMACIGEMQVDVRAVAFSVAQEIIKPNVMTWEDFIKGGSDTAPEEYPAPEDLATIRYTSGTTGEPKGVMFNFRQLTWMGQVLTGLLTWQDRNRPLRYLSFLPLSHVVEGILACYAPYYVLAPVDYFFLNDFGALTDALPKVRPTIFFSVPRFYEKLWDQIMANPLGQRWFSMKDGPAKRGVGALLRRVILKKAGLDACRQLIVGSAPVSEALLLNFRALGVEIHNAYGQTEAPLITINRVGDNVIPTIGTPLPETEVTAESDGELIVKGPQVTLGYYGLETDTIKNGVLRTGDLGVIHENGHITLIGRKKEMIVTAYGKNISIPKIEELLKSIPGVSEAVLIGEHRPYCTALIWLEEDAADLDAAIEQMNAGLSHPEQIRKYAVIPEPLSIQKGELTPNLKVKRANVEAHFRDDIEGMYR